MIRTNVFVSLISATGKMFVELCLSKPKNEDFQYTAA